MAINLKFDLMGNPEPPSIILANRNGNKLGQLNVNVESIDVSDKFNAASEFSFTLHKYIDGERTPLWDKVKDFKLVYCPEWDLWFEIKVELDETAETVKTVFCTQLGQSELSQIKIYNIHINEEGDPNWDTNNETYKSTILYDPHNTDVSLLHRLLKDKAPHYSIAYVDESIQRIQKSFSFDDTSICDAFNEIAEEIGCLFVYNSNSTKGGKPNRTISVYDLQQNCKDCGYRGEFTDKCPKCESTNIKCGYGEDTLIFVTSDELGSQGIQLVTDVDSVKNCFKLEGGDDLMTATIRNCNPNGTDYIWYFSNALKEDMPKELVEKLESYDNKYQDYYNNHISKLNEDMVNQYNNLVNKYKAYYDTKSTCLNCGHEEYFQEQCPKCNSKNILNGNNLQTIPTTINGYSDLMTAYYNTIDLLLYLDSSLMPTPDIEANKTTAKEQIELLTNSTLSPVAVNVKEVKNITETTAKSAVLSMAKILIKPTYKVDVVDDSSSLGEMVYTDNTIGQYKKWKGQFKVTNYSDEDDVAISEIIEVYVGNDAKTFIEQKIDKALNKENTDDYSVTGLFAKEYDDFCVELTKYALNPLDNFSKVCDTVISILAEQGVGDDGSNANDKLEKENKKVLYDALYKPYFDKQQAINNEINVRENEIIIIEGAWDKSDENNPRCMTWGLQQYIEECQQDIQEELDFEKHLGEDLWLEFCAYRREDKYSNSNYVSDGLNNAELFEKALEFIEVAEEEIFKSAELQHSISATLNNLLSLPKFKLLLKSFKTGNWIRVQVDDKVYKLRLLEYGFGYGDFESITVEFSDVTKIKNGVTDVKDIIEQASSIASSYDSVQRQAEKGNIARSTIDQWLVDGLDSANVQIKNNNSEEILLTKNGLLARSYDDITGTYSPEQFKLTHNIMVYTNDNWETVSSALGKHNYKKWNGSSFVDDEDYGLTSKFVTAGYITGSQVIGGEIVSFNYEPKKSGTYINLLNGDFDFAGGKIVYDADDNNVRLKGVTIQWTGDDGVNAPEVKVENVTGLDKYLDQLDDLENQLDGRVQTYSQSEDPSTSWTDEEKSNHIGDLWINPDNGITKRWVGTEWVEVTDSDLKELAASKAQIFTSQPTPPYYIGDLWVQGSTGDILHCVNKRESGSYVSSDWVKSSKYTDDTTLINFIDGDYADTLDELNQSIKNAKARSWYQAEDPSESWDNTENHIGDLWYCCDENQKTYIYTDSGWQETNVPKAVFDTIDGKRQIFVSKPNSAYSTGDLWIISDLDCDSKYNVINDVTYAKNTTLVAKLPSGVNERTEYVASDWVDISTHDGKLALDNSKQAIDALNDISDDNKITPTEKQQIKFMMQNIASEYNDILKQCSKYSITTTNFKNAYNNLKGLTDGMLVDLTTTISPLPSGYPDLFTEYYSAKELIISDIEDATKEYADNSLSSFIDGEYSTTIKNIRNEVDGKAETWYQSEDPSSSWAEDEYSKHVGDLWHYTGATTNAKGRNSEWIWQNISGVYQWVAMDVPDEIFDAIDGKSTIYISKPNSQQKGDLLIPNSTFTFGSYTFVEQKVYRCTNNNDTFVPDYWIEVAYTDDTALETFISGEYKDNLDSINNQIDKKARSWYQSTDPSLTWDVNEDHEGDLWYNSSVNSQVTYIYKNNTWQQTSVPKALFDTIDGIASIYITEPESAVVGDLLIPVTDIKNGDTVKYKAGKVYRYSGSNWNEISYTDDSRADEAYVLANSAKGVADNAKIIGDNLVVGLGFQKSELTEEYVISPVIAGGHLLIGDTTGTYAQITTGGKLICTNADVSGHINATSLTLGSSAKISTSNINGLSTVATSGQYADLDGSPDLSVYATTDVLNNYVTNSSLSSQLGSYATSGELADYLKTSDLNDKLGDLNVAYRGDIQTTQTIDNETGIITTTSTYTDVNGVQHTTTTYTTNSGDYVLLSRDNQWGTGETLVKISKDGLLEAENAIISGEIYASKGSFTGDIIADSLTLRTDIKLGNDTDGYHTWISKDGILHTENANISGEINATSGTIGGCQIEDGVLQIKNVNIAETITADQIDATNLKVDAANVSGKLVASQIDAYDIVVNAANIDGTLTADQIDATNLKVKAANVSGTLTASTISVSNLTAGANNVPITFNGEFVAPKATITGTINATEGEIAGWSINEHVLQTQSSFISSNGTFYFYTDGHSCGFGEEIDDRLQPTGNYNLALTNAGLKIGNYTLTADKLRKLLELIS